MKISRFRELRELDQLRALLGDDRAAVAELNRRLGRRRMLRLALVTLAEIALAVGLGVLLASLF